MTKKLKSGTPFVYDENDRVVGIRDPHTGTDTDLVTVVRSPGVGVVFDPEVEAAIAALGSGIPSTSGGNLPIPLSSFAGVVGDGKADDTLVLLAAFDACLVANKALLIDVPTRFIAGTVPAGKRTAGIGGDYVLASSIIGTPRGLLLVEGKIGFDQGSVDDSYVTDLDITTSGREITSAQLKNTSPYLFTSLTAKRSARFENVKISNSVTDATTGGYRTNTCIFVSNAANARYVNVTANNCAAVVVSTDGASAYVNTLVGENIEAACSVTRTAIFHIRNIVYKNTKAQQLLWIAKTASPARNFAGLDAVYVDNAVLGAISSVYCEWPIERSLYVCSGNVSISDCKVVNGENVKVVGNSRTDIARNVWVSNCHLTLDSTFELRAGRPPFSNVITYWSEAVTIVGCTARSVLPAGTGLRACVSNGLDSHTTRGVFVSNCHAENASTFFWNSMSSLTAAALTELDPAQTFVMLDGLTIENCSIRKNQSRYPGTLVYNYDTSASTDAKLAYAIKNVILRNNTVQLNPTNGRDDWLFDVRYSDSVFTENNDVNIGFFNGGISAAVTAPHQNITMREGNFKDNVGTGPIVYKLAFLLLKRGSYLKFHGELASKVITKVVTKVYEDGPASGGSKTIDVEGKGYWQHSKAINATVEMIASGDYYVGKCVAGVKTDQVGTPPITMTPGASNLEIRGDLFPTVQYKARLTLL